MAGVSNAKTPGRPHSGLAVKALCFKAFEAGWTISDVRRMIAHAKPHDIYEARRAHEIYRASKGVAA